MSARYNMFENPPQEGDEGKRMLHPRLVVNGTVSAEEFIKLAGSTSSIKTADLKGAFDLISGTLASYLAAGYNVELEGLGIFSLSLKSRPVEKKEDIHAQSIDLGAIHFRASPDLRRNVKHMMVLERVDNNPKKMTFTIEERESRMKWYFDRNRFITCRVYASLNHCSRTKALDDLNLFREQGKIERKGRGNQGFYFPL